MWTSHVARPPQSEFVPASAWATIKRACRNVMFQPYIVYINILKPERYYYMAYLMLNIQNKVSFDTYIRLIPGNVPDRLVIWKMCLQA